VRRATDGDRAFVVGLAARFGDTRAAWRTHAEVTNGTVRELGAAFDRDANDTAFFIAYRDDDPEPLGFAFVVTEADFFTREPHGHLSEIATTGDGSGAASALMAACEAWSRERGFRYLSLNVNDTNEHAHAIYRRRDYIPEYRHLVKLLQDGAGPETTE
jgi:GNAT superfamily N-acetyltransferase